MFLRGMPFEPPRAGMMANTSGMLGQGSVFSNQLSVVSVRGGTLEWRARLGSRIIELRLPGGPAAVDDEIIAGHVGGGVGGEEQQCAVHFILAGHAPEDGLSGIILDEGIVVIIEDAAGRQRVDA